LTPVFHVLEAETGALLPDSIRGGFNIAVASPRGTTAWLPDASGFVYIRRRDLPPDAPPHDQTVGMETRLHVLGTDPGTDRVVFGGAVSRRLGLPADAWPWLEFSHGSPYVLALVASHDGSTPAFYAAPVDSLHAAVVPWRQVAFPEDEVRGPLGWVHFGEHLYLKSARDAPHFQVLRRSLADPTAAAEVVVGEGDGVIDGLAATSDALYVTLLRLGRHRLLRVPHDGKASQVIELSHEGAISHRDLITDPQHPELLFGFSSPTRFSRYYLYDPAVGAVIDTRWLEPSPAERELGSGIRTFSRGSRIETADRVLPVACAGMCIDLVYTHTDHVHRTDHRTDHGRADPHSCRPGGEGAVSAERGARGQIAERMVARGREGSCGGVGVARGAGLTRGAGGLLRGM
jgi:hypothetical protein